VVHNFAQVVKAVWTFLPHRLGFSPGIQVASLSSPAVISFAGVGQVAEHEQPFPPVRSADFRRRKQSRLNAVAHCFQSTDDMLSEKSDRSADVLKKDPSGPALADNALRIGP